MNGLGKNAAMTATGASTTAAVDFHPSRYCSVGICFRPIAVAYTPTMAVPMFASAMKATATMPIHKPVILTNEIEGSALPVARLA